MSKPRVLVLTGYGINCDDETQYAFERAGGIAHIIHVNDIIGNPQFLNGYQIFVFPGGFSYGDDTGSGKALANRIKNNLIDEFRKFADKDNLILGICNGFQVMANLGLVPGLKSSLEKAEVSLEHNVSARYECRWVDLSIENESRSVFTEGIDSLHIPVAHGEGNFYAPDDVLSQIEEKNLVVMRYSMPDGNAAKGKFPYNPNGSLNDIAAICDETGRVMGMMPHPERNILFTQRDDWTYIREKIKREGRELPDEGVGMQIFRNAVRYFS